MGTQAEVARHLDVSTGRLRQLQADGVIPIAAAGELDVDACRIAYLRHLRKGASGRGSRVRQELDKVKLQRARYDLAEKQRTLVPIDEVMPIFERRLVAIRQVMLAVPAKVAPLILPDDPAAAQALIHEAVWHALEDARGIDDDLSDPEQKRQSVAKRT